MRDFSAGVKAMYGRSAGETWSRTFVEARVEQAVLDHLCDQYLTGALTIYDIGGGNGVNAIKQARRGHHVWLSDLTPQLVSDAAQRDRTAGSGVRGFTVADARELPYSDDSADACLLLGPLYHLPERADRVRALSEARRVLRPGGLAFLQTLTRAGGMRMLQRHFPEDILRIDWKDFFSAGTFPSDHPSPLLRTTYFALPDQTTSEAAEAGFELVKIVAQDGPSPDAQATMHRLQQKVIDEWAQAAIYASADPCWYLTANTLLHLVRKPA